MRFLAGTLLLAVLGTATAQFLDPCKSKTRTSAHESQCDAYYECFNGQAVEQNCPNGLVYNGSKKRGLIGVCDYDHKVDCFDRPTRSLAQQQLQQPDPCDHRHQVVGDITYCDRYWECVGGVPQNYDCPNGLVFVGRNRGIAEGCDYPWRGGYCDNKQLANPPLSTEHCDWLYGIFGHETSCTRYWSCGNGTATEQFCIGGLFYNEETHGCDWPSNVRGCQKHPLCTEDPDANVPLGSSCERYWACQGGYPRLQRCPATLVFDKQSRRCVAPPTQDCEAPITTEAPFKENQFRRAQGRRPPQGRPQSQSRPQPQQSHPVNDDQSAPLRPPQGRPQSRPQPQLSSQSQGRPEQSRPVNIAPQSSPERPFVPAGAIPVQFNEPQQQGGFSPQQGGFNPQQQQQERFRPPPIAGAIPLK